MRESDQINRFIASKANQIINLLRIYISESHLLLVIIKFNSKKIYLRIDFQN